MLTGLGLLALAIVIVLAVVWVFQRRLIYFPLSERVPPVATIMSGAEDVSFDTEDGHRLRGWFLPPTGASRGTILVFNGNAGDRSFRAPLAMALVRAGLSVLLFDYRGYGGNPGNPSERGLMADARAARAYLVARQDVDTKSIVYFGESLGAAVAVALAVEHPPAALILRSPFTSLSDMASVHYPFLPTGVLLWDRFDSFGRIGRVTCPVLVVTGDRDQVVPPAQSRQLYEAIQSRARLVVVPGADHNDYALLAGPELVEAIVRFVDTIPNLTP